MTERADVVIIGGGVVGASIAYHLAEAGCRDVLVVERGQELGEGSTGRATGGVRAQFATAVNIRMSLYSIDFFSRFSEATGRDCGYRPIGYLFLAGERQLAQLESNRERQRAVGLTCVEILSTDDIAARLPLLRLDDIAGGSFCPIDGLIDPLAVMRGLLKRARERGVTLWTDTRVTGIDLDGGAVVSVDTSRGRVATRAVVNAAGPWAAEVARLAGVEIPVTPLRRQLVGAQSFDRLPERMPMVIDLSDGFHFRRVEHGAQAPGVLLAWPDPEETPGFNTDFDDDFTGKILERAARRVPAFAGLKVDRRLCRAGLYEMTPDHHAIIGRAPGVAGFYLANGFSGHGVMHSPATGRAVSDLILHGESRAIDIHALRAERFAEGDLIEESVLL
ncbi:MAG TPA: FAD-binding oxidoreductase [Pyrinomonadaceae bacterium]